MADPVLSLSDTHGVYIPQIWCADLTPEEAERIGIQWADVVTCQAGPDGEWYWEAWQSILDNAAITDADGETWRLLQEGDLWEVPDSFDLSANGWLYP